MQWVPVYIIFSRYTKKLRYWKHKTSHPIYRIQLLCCPPPPLSPPSPISPTLEPSPHLLFPINQFPNELLKLTTLLMQSLKWHERIIFKASTKTTRCQKKISHISHMCTILDQILFKRGFATILDLSSTMRSSVSHLAALLYTTDVKNFFLTMQRNPDMPNWFPSVY